MNHIAIIYQIHSICTDLNTDSRTLWLVEGIMPCELRARLWYEWAHIVMVF